MIKRADLLSIKSWLKDSIRQKIMLIYSQIRSFSTETNYSISGGLEPSEEASWSLAPNMFSEWGKVDAPSDAIFTVTVERIDGADGKALYSTSEFGEREEKRLSELKEQYNVKLGS